jgi:hypothetical protein
MKKFIKIVIIVFIILIAAFLVVGIISQPKKKEFPSSPRPPEGKSIIPLGISILPKGEPKDWGDEEFTEAFQKAKEAGISVAVSRYGWGEVEPSLGEYKWSDLDYEINKTKQQGFKYSVVLEIIHTNSLGRYPDGINFSKFDDPTFINAFKNFIKEFVNRYKGKIDYLWIGNEVGEYLHQSKNQLEPFLRFYSEAETAIKSVDSKIKVGIVDAYHLARNNNEIAMLKEFSQKGDLLGLTLYMEDDNSNPDVSDTQNYFYQLFRELPVRKIAIIETSWSSRGPKGSEKKQAEYIKELAKVITQHQNKLEFFSWFTLYDLPGKINRQIAESFGVSTNTKVGQEFVNWQGSLGLLKNNGASKTAWDVWKKEMLIRSELNSKSDCAWTVDGNCKMILNPGYYYDFSKEDCVFYRGGDVGCRQPPFKTKEDCLDTCLD